MNTTKTRLLTEVRQEYSEARAAREQQLEGLRQELAAVQREAIAATTAGDRKAAAAVGSRLQVLTASVAAIEAELRDMNQHAAEAEIAWAQSRAAALEATLPSLESAAREARDKVKAAEAQARASVEAAYRGAGDADGAVTRARSELDGCGRVVGSAKVLLARLDPTPVAPGMVGTLPLAQRLGRFVAIERTNVQGRSVEAGEIVELPGPEAVGFVTAAKHAPDRPTPLRSMVETPVLNPGPLQFLGWIAAPPKPEPVFRPIPSSELAPPVLTPAPRRVRVVSDCMIGGQSRTVGEIVNLTPKEAADLRGCANVEAVE